DGGDYSTDGMVARQELKGVPLPKALDQLLEPLGLSWWYGRPSKKLADIQPSIWVSTPTALETLKQSDDHKLTFNMAQLTMDMATKAKIIEAFGTPPAVDDS